MKNILWKFWRGQSWRGNLAALAAGAVLPLAYAPFEIFPVALLSVAALFFLWRGQSPRRAAARGYWYGLGQFGVGVSWVWVSIHDFGGIGPLSALLFTALFIAVLACFPALLGYLLARSAQREVSPALAYLSLYPAGWTLSEWVRSWFLSGFPWLNLGYSHIDTPLAGWAPVLGVYGVSWIVAFTAGTLIFIAVQKTRRPRLGALGGIALLWGSGILLQTIAWTTPAGSPIRASLIQGNIPQDIKWSAEMIQPTLEIYARLTHEHWDSQLIVWPETAIPLFYHQVEPYLDALAAQARAHGADLLIGLPVLDPDTQRYYNGMVSVGSTRAFYYKHHLVPFTEYLPLKEVLGSLVNVLNVPMSDFSAGAAYQTPLKVAGVRVGISICYEDAFGEETIRALPEATVLVNVSNDAWFGASIAPAQHLQMARMRALETGRPLLRATNTGLTAFISPQGKVMQQAPQFHSTVLTGHITPMQGATPYARVGNWAVVGGLVVLLAGIFSLRRYTR